MDYNDTKYINIESTLNAIGKAAFVNFYYDFKDTTITTDVLAEKIYRESEKAKSKRQGFRIPRARHIFELGQELEALKIIINSQKVELSAREKAQQILSEELFLRMSSNEHNKEQQFISVLNNELPYANGEVIEYDNSPKPAKPGLDITTHKYPRSHKISQRALSMANHLCEISPEHETFKRRNCDKNYTEPHHLVPLFAAKDFPGIDLDREQNIISLCSNCHNWLHYGDNIDTILKPLYDCRKELLKAIGIDITYDQLKSYY